MNKELEIFENPELGQLRVLMIDGEPWFVGKDVAEILGYKNTSDAVRTHVEEKDRFKARIPKESGESSRLEMVAINKEGFLKLVFSGNRPTATAFQEWVNAEILPVLEGSSLPKMEGKEETEIKVEPSVEIIPQEIPYGESPMDLQVALELEREQNKLLTTALTKALTKGVSQNFTTKISKSSIPFPQYLQSMCLLLPNFTEESLLKHLRNKGVLTKKYISYPQKPLMKYICCGYFEIHGELHRVNNEFAPFQRTYITTKGIQFLTDLLLEESVHSQTQAI